MKSFDVTFSVTVDAADETAAYTKVARHFGCLADGIEPDTDIPAGAVTIREKPSSRKAAGNGRRKK